MNNHLPAIRNLKAFSLLGLLIVLACPVDAQSRMVQGEMDFYAAILGVSPTFYKRIRYQKGEFDFNAVPIYLETNPDGVVAFRLNPYLNLAVRNEKSTVVKNFGVGLALPIYPYRSDLDKKQSHHFYIAPAGEVLIGPNEFEADVDINLFLEPGYSFRFLQVSGVSLGISLGKTLSIRSDALSWNDFYAIRLSWYWVFY